MKIKRKVQLTLLELIEWAFENNITRRWYRANNTEGYISEVFFNFPRGLPQFSSTVDKQDTFTVEIEEEITEDTELSEMMVIFSDGTSDLTNNKSLNYLIRETSLKSAYIMNDDLRLILIWTHDKGLVE